MTIDQVAWLFPGQGAQKVGMGQALYAHNPIAKALFEEADTLLDFPLSRLMFEGPKEELDETFNTQPALYVHSLAMLRVAQAEGKLPQAAWVAGHSMGEFSALAAAGSLSFAEGLRLVRERGRLMRKAGQETPGGMAAILRLSDEKVTTLCAEITATGNLVQVANYNCPGQVVITGTLAGVAQASQAARAAGARKVVQLAISIPAHSPLMASALADFNRLVEETPIKDAQIPLIANATAQPIQSAPDIRAELLTQLTDSVRWTESMQFLVQQGITNVIEIGSGNVLTGLMKRIHRKGQRQNLETWADLMGDGDW